MSERTITMMARDWGTDESDNKPRGSRRRSGALWNGKRQERDDLKEERKRFTRMAASGCRENVYVEDDTGRPSLGLSSAGHRAGEGGSRNLGSED